MANLATSLLDFILDLLRDPETAAEFRADPQGTLDSAGLGDLCPADIQNARLVLDELPPAGVSNAAVTGAVSPAAAVGTTAPVLATTTDVSPASESPDTDSVIEQLRYIQQTFTYNSETTIDVRDSVWAGKDVYQIFGDDAVLATGDGIAAGGDVDDVTIDRSVEIEDSFTIDDSFNPVNSGNEVDGNGNAVGRGNDVDNTDNSIEVDDSTGTVVGDDNETGDAVSGDGNVVGNEVDIADSGNDNSDTSTVIQDSGNDNSDNSDNSIDVELEDSFNDNSTDLEVELEDSFNEVDAFTNVDVDAELENVGNTDSSTTITDNFSGNEVAVAVAEDDADATV